MIYLHMNKLKPDLLYLYAIFTHHLESMNITKKNPTIFNENLTMKYLVDDRYDWVINEYSTTRWHP